MSGQELKDRITIGTIIEALNDMEPFQQSYENSQHKILADIESRLKGVLEADIAVINDIKDCISIGEEKAFIIGFCEGMKLMKQK